MARVFRLENGHLGYDLQRDGHVVIDTSMLGIKVGKKILGAKARMISEYREEVAISYPLNGVKSEATFRADKFTIKLEESDGFVWYLECVLSQEGFAIRYRIPNQGEKKVFGEITSFRLPPDTKVWYFERDNDWKLKSHAGEWRVADISDMPTVSKMGPIQGLTLTLEMPQGGYAMVAESALFNYSGMRLKTQGENTFVANFTEGEEGFVVSGEILSPWRCIILADDLNELVNNTMVASLNPPPDQQLFAQSEWIIPGKSVWHWWSGKYLDFEEEMDMIDDAADLGFKYSMVDDGWEAWEDKWGKINGLSTYAKKKGVEIFVWKHSKEINIPDRNYAVMGRFLDSVRQVGAVGIKVDFMNGQTKSIIDFDEALLRSAAERRLMVNFHGCQQSSGEYRTYPNEVTREGIRGLEVNHMKEGPLPASHNAALPFTRYVTGHADYTPLGFTEPGETTWAHQLGTLVCFYSAFNCIAENTQFLLKNELIRPCLDFIREVPTTWDQTIVLPQSRIGQLAAIARRKGNDWYLGVLSSGSPRELVVDCNFLNNGEYKVNIFSDDTDAALIPLEGLNREANLRQWSTAVPFKLTTQVVTSASKIELNIAANGGAALYFEGNKSIIEKDL